MLQKMIKPKLILLFILAILVIGKPVTATTNTARVYANDIAVYQGSGSYIDVYIENAPMIAALEFEIKYDPSFSVGGYYQGSLLSNELFDLNLSQPGEIRFTFTSVNGLNGNGHLFSVHIQIPSDTPIGDYFVHVAVLEVYDVALNPIHVVGSTNKIKVLPKQSTNTNGTISSQVSKNNLKQGDSFNYTISGYNLNQLVAGEININFDSDVLSLKTTTLSGHFDQNGSIYSVNEGIQGQIKVAFVFDNYLDYLYPILSIEFEVIEDNNVSTSVSAELINAYSESLNIITFNKTNQVINIVETPDIIDYKNMYTTTYQGSATEPFTIDVMIEADSKLSAGDFVLNYNLNHLIVVGVEIGQQVSSNGGITMYNPVIDQGQIKFTYINENGLTQNEVLLTITFKPKFDNFNIDTSITISQTGDVVDNSFNRINLEFIQTTIKLFEVKTYHFLNTDGSVYQTIKTDIGSSIELPSGPIREGTTFNSWKLQSDVNNIAIYIPTYTLNTGIVEINGFVKVFDGTTFDLDISSMVLGVSSNIKSSNVSSVGEHLIEIDIYLDGTYQYTVTKTGYILKSIGEINIESKAIILAYQGYLDHLGEVDQVTLQSIIEAAITDYDAWISLINQDYELALKIKTSINYYNVIIALQFNLNAYYWRRQL